MALTYEMRGKDERTPVLIVVIVNTVVIPEIYKCYQMVLLDSRKLWHFLKLFGHFQAQKLWEKYHSLTEKNYFRTLNF